MNLKVVLKHEYALFIDITDYNPIINKYLPLFEDQ